MELKDWILLFIPILFNGILIWIFQFMLKSFFEHKEFYKKLREQIFNVYIEKLSECIELNRKVTFSVVNSSDNNDLEQNIYKLRDNIRNLLFYYEMYTVILSTNDKVANEYSKIKIRYMEWIENWNNNNIQISFLKDCGIILQSIMNECLKYIYGIK